ncbi:MAG: aspartate--tRNA ligase [Defluviitaleaceae bacterium]|nr:aspartate--tRNA ligase [Defluviitaleaceae bacterium]
MGESMKGMKRTHYCGELTAANVGQDVTVMGWVNKNRDMSQRFFIVVRDRTGLVQVVVDAERAVQYALAKEIRGEYVIAARGKVIARTPQNVNPEMPTGEIEIDIEELRILSESDTPPFTPLDEGVAMDTRLKYRYLDLRRADVHKIMKLRHTVAQTIRRYLTEEGYIEVETPYLTNSSPEGARDYLVPSRNGGFYALPQSPQQLKQLLMVAGMDKYFQIAKCFRDEDLRADRQPEFTQIDIEASFVDEEDIHAMMEGMMQRVFKEAMDVDVAVPFPRMTWLDAMEKYGTDKPDLRYGLELVDLSALPVIADTDFQVFAAALENGGRVRGINATGLAALPRKQIDALVETARGENAKGLAWINLMEDGTIKSTIGKFFDDAQTAEIITAMAARPGDLILLCADTVEISRLALGAVRVALGKHYLPELPAGTFPTDFKFLWVTHFPLFEYAPEEGRYYAAHHPFTSPLEEDEHLLESDPGAVRARQYDLVLNGSEQAGGSIRIHRRDLQDRMFAALGFTPERAKAGFAHFLEALQYGVPPHGGIAPGLDRLIMNMTGATSLREVIAFPKVKDGSCPMTEAPGPVDAAQLEELGIAVVKSE